ncbi:GIY-YIG nuclease family protein [Pontibacter roseus]|uniref:GIY-YIG nuclease family protein n=1 Tax=Pontibacter roseus TaxID=336989 RepID=UPI0003A13C02|nr:GIY-YIG nuclease family protein [Pontibacter roseus]
MNRLEDIFKDDPFGLLKVDYIQASGRTSDEQRLIQSFEEISTFFEENGREPSSSGIYEFKLYARLKAIRETPAKVKVLLPFDYYSLLDPQKYKSVGIEDILNDDPFGLLAVEDFDQSIFKLEHVPKSNRIRPDYLARRKICKDFDKYQEIFDCLHDELASGKRKLAEFNGVDVEVGKFYVLNGVVLYLEDSKAEARQNDFDSGGRVRLDGRTRCIFDNGTESTMLFRSLVKALAIDGFEISESIQYHDADSVVDENDEENGYIYILKSKSNQPEITSINNLYKIGYSKGDVTKRIKKAKQEPTYLMADVELISAFRCFNMSTKKLETTIHAFFDEVRLDVEILDNYGKKCRPKEWFVAPIEVIEEAVRHIVDDNIDKFIYNSKTESIIFKSSN